MKSKYYIKKEIDLLIMKINVLRQNYLIYKQIKFKGGYENIAKFLPYTSNIILTALIDKILMELSKLVVDGNDNDLCIYSFIKKYKADRKSFKEKKYIYVKDIDSDKKHRMYIDTNEIEDDINNLEKFLNDNKHIRSYLKKIRDKKIAHNDRKMNFKSNYLPVELKQKITYEELSNFIDGLFKNMNTIYSTLFKIQYAYLEETEHELKYLNEILEKERKIYEQ